MIDARTDREPMVWFSRLLTRIQLPQEVKDHVALVFDNLIGRDRQPLELGMITKSLAVAYLQLTRMEADILQSDPTTAKAVRLSKEYRAWMHALDKLRRSTRLKVKVDAGKKQQQSGGRHAPLWGGKQAPTTDPDTNANTA